MRSRGPWHISPVTLLIFSALGGLSLTMFPPTLYEELLGEKNKMFLNVELISYIFLCVTAASAGVFLAGRLKTNHREAGAADKDLWSVYWAAAVVFLIFILIAFTMHEQLTAIALGAVNGEAGAVRDAMVADLRETGFSPTNLIPLALPFIYFGRGVILKASVIGVKSNKIKRAKSIINWTTSIYGVLLVITLNRNLLVPFLLGLFCLESGLMWHKNGIKKALLVKILAIGLSVFTLIFAIFSFSRDGSDESPWTLLVGYLPASYNRLAYQLDGELKSPMNFPYYSLRFLWHPPLIRRALPMNDISNQLGIDLPENSIEGWLSEFENLSKTRLDPRFIWPTAFGYVFYDYGWGALIFFVLFGFICGWAWLRFRYGNVFGLIMYPYFSSCIILLSTDIIISTPQTVTIFFAACFLWLIQKIKFIKI
jgi:hypothetical protein